MTNINKIGPNPYTDIKYMNVDVLNFTLNLNDLLDCIKNDILNTGQLVYDDENDEFLNTLMNNIIYQEDIIVKTVNWLPGNHKYFNKEILYLNPIDTSSNDNITSFINITGHKYYTRGDEFELDFQGQVNCGTYSPFGPLNISHNMIRKSLKVKIIKEQEFLDYLINNDKII